MEAAQPTRARRASHSAPTASPLHSPLRSRHSLPCSPQVAGAGLCGLPGWPPPSREAESPAWPSSLDLQGLRPRSPLTPKRRDGQALSPHSPRTPDFCEPSVAAGVEPKPSSPLTPDFSGPGPPVADQGPPPRSLQTPDFFRGSGQSADGDVDSPRTPNFRGPWPPIVDEGEKEQPPFDEVATLRRYIVDLQQAFGLFLKQGGRDISADQVRVLCSFPHPGYTSLLWLGRLPLSTALESRSRGGWCQENMGLRQDAAKLSWKAARG